MIAGSDVECTRCHRVVRVKCQGGPRGAMVGDAAVWQYMSGEKGKQAPGGSYYVEDAALCAACCERTYGGTDEPLRRTEFLGFLAELRAAALPFASEVKEIHRGLAEWVQTLTARQIVDLLPVQSAKTISTLPPFAWDSLRQRTWSRFVEVLDKRPAGLRRLSKAAEQILKDELQHRRFHERWEKVMGGIVARARSRLPKLTGPLAMPRSVRRDNILCTLSSPVSEAPDAEVFDECVATVADLDQHLSYWSRKPGHWWSRRGDPAAAAQQIAQLDFGVILDAFRRRQMVFEPAGPAAARASAVVGHARERFACNLVLVVGAGSMILRSEQLGLTWRIDPESPAVPLVDSDSKVVGHYSLQAYFLDREALEIRIMEPKWPDPAHPHGPVEIDMVCPVDALEARQLERVDAFLHYDATIPTAQVSLCVAWK